MNATSSTEVLECSLHSADIHFHDCQFFGCMKKAFRWQCIVADY